MSIVSPEVSKMLFVLRIVPKICQSQPPTMYSRLHPNGFTFGGDIAECVNTAISCPNVNPIFNRSLASHRIITHAYSGRRDIVLTLVCVDIWTIRRRRDHQTWHTCLIISEPWKPVFWGQSSRHKTVLVWVLDSTGWSRKKRTKFIAS